MFNILDLLSLKKTIDFYKIICYTIYRKEREVIKMQEINKYIVLNPDGTVAGIPCRDFEEARELANQRDGRIVTVVVYQNCDELTPDYFLKEEEE